MYDEYDLECIFILGIEIEKMLLLNIKYIDTYFEDVKEIYKDYKKYDNENKSLLESIHDYINNNENKLLLKVVSD